MKTSRALFVVYGFPPEGARGTKRSLKFIRYLEQYGWSVVVLTVRSSPNYSFHDGSLLKELPENLPVYRARTLENLFHQTRHVKQGEIQDPLAESNKSTRPSTFRCGLLCIYRSVGKFLSIPDSRVLWLPFAVAKGWRAMRDQPCDVIYSSGPTHVNHIVGAILSRLKGIPLVMDFRDAWVGDPARTKNRWWVEWGNEFLERFCIRRAAVVICTTEGIKADFERRYPEVTNKYVTITNGFDPEDFPVEGSSNEFSSRRALRVVHAGTLGGERSPKEFLVALGSILQERPDLRGCLEIVFVGQNSRFADGRTIEEYIHEYGCGDVVKLAGFVARKASLDYIIEADLLLLIIGRVPAAGAFEYGISGKIYDYAAARRPVLTISEPGSSAQMAERLNLGPVIHPDRIEEIKSVMLSLCEAYKVGKIPYSPNLELLKSFEFSSLTGLLAESFERAAQVKNKDMKTAIAVGVARDT